MMINLIFCSLLELIHWLQNHLLTCPFKAITGLDCPGCGFQRSVIALVQGNWSQSFHLYAATIPLLITASIFATDRKLKFDRKDTYKKGLSIFTGIIILGSYLIKMYALSH